MNFPTAFKTCFLEKYATFSGRAARSEYWYFVLFIFLVNILTATIDGIVFSGSPVLYGLFSLIVLIPNFAVAVRRLHDVNRSGWWLLLWLTVIGVVVLLYWLIKNSDPGDNDYGSNPFQKSQE